jgi:2,3-bisphosphoglycerate-independent phosphoglycerate mutase
MKYLILVGDGMGDYPIPELNGKTVLEAADTPMMDELCHRGEFFLNQTVPEGFPPGSDVANMSLMGYDPALYYTGRAPLEAASMGIELASDEIAFRCNLVTLDTGNRDRIIMEDFAAGHISSEEARQIIRSLEEECSTDQFHFKAGISYRHLMIYKGTHPGITTVPPHDFIEKDVTRHYQNYLAIPEWRQLLEKSQTLLAGHPVNLQRIKEGKNPATHFWLWGEGKMVSAPTLAERFQISGTMISAVDLLKGLGVIGNLTVVDVPGATGDIDTNYRGKAGAAMDSLKDQDFVFVHLEAPDEAGHQGSLADKTRAIEDFDELIVKPIVQHLRDLPEDFRVVVTMDHFTPLSLRTHVADAVPTLLYDSREETTGSGQAFNEKSCANYHNRQGNAITRGYTMIEKLLERS